MLTEENKTSEINKTVEMNEIKYKNVKITENIDGKAIKIAEGSFGKVYKVSKYINEKNVKDIIPFAQKQTHIFKKDGNIIGQNLKEVSLGYKYLKNKNTQEFNYVMIEEKNNLSDSKYIINMLLADMTFYDLIYSNLNQNDRLFFFFPILKQIVTGVSYINSNYICHGDIKPENILIFGKKGLDLKDIFNNSSTNLRDYLKTAMFRVSDYSGINMEYNISMDKTSTLYYRAPELFIKYDKKFKKSVKETYGSFNDIWSIGIMMLEYLTKSNIISKLYKKNMKIGEKDFLYRFFNCMKSLDVSIVLKNSGYDINNNYIKNICNILDLMLCKKINERINIYNLSIFVNHYIEKDIDTCKELYSNNFNNTIFNEIIEYNNDIKPEFINLNFRRFAINELLSFFNDEKYSDVNDKQYLPLGLSLFDRLISRGILNKSNNQEDESVSEESQYEFNENDANLMKYMYTKTLFECYYISSRFLLSDIDIIFICDFLNIDIDIIHMDILEILKQIDFDIYRPTILTYLNNQSEDMYQSQYIIKKSIELFCNTDKINTEYYSSIDSIDNLISLEQNLTDSKTDIFKYNNIDIDLAIPKLERDIYN